MSNDDMERPDWPGKIYPSETPQRIINYLHDLNDYIDQIEAAFVGGNEHFCLVCGARPKIEHLVPGAYPVACPECGAIEVYRDDTPAALRKAEAEVERLNKVLEAIREECERDNAFYASSKSLRILAILDRKETT